MYKMPMYKNFIAPILFQVDPERAHHLSLSWGGNLAKLPGVFSVLKNLFFTQPAAKLSCSVMGLKMKSPLMIAAGLDKDCEAFEALSATGVGAIELGTVTPEPQAGNPTPRVFRLIKERSLINRLGFPSCGLTVFRKRLERVNRRDTLVGVNIGKNKDTALESCESDYERCARETSDLADYITINVSSPNTPGLRALQTPEMLTRVIRAVQHGNKMSRPVAVKISPDCTAQQIEELVDCCLLEKIAGIIATNTTVWRPDDFAEKSASGRQQTGIYQQTGGLSGALLAERALASISAVLKANTLNSNLEAALSVIGAGGVSSAHDARAMLSMGCAAVQLYSSLVYQGPGLIGRINEGLLRL